MSSCRCFLCASLMQAFAYLQVEKLGADNMPIFHKRKLSEVPKASRTSRAIREKQELYEGFINAIGAEVGELELAEGEAVRATKVRIRRAATRLGTDIQIWDSDGKVYFSRTQHRGRPRKAKV